MQFVVFCGEFKLQHCTIFFYLFLKIDFILLCEAEWCSSDTLDLYSGNACPESWPGHQPVAYRGRGGVFNPPPPPPPQKKNLKAFQSCAKLNLIVKTIKNC